MKEETRYCIVISIIILCVAFIACFWVHSYFNRMNKLVEAGYTQKTLAGASCPRWVKD